MTRPAFTEEQLAAIADRSGSRLLAANAGSGKTAVMVERFVEAVLDDGIGVEAILALTFTDKAAAELRERVRRRFADLGAHEQARAAEGAWVGTIHGFCARVLRAHPFGAGLDPRVGVLDEPASRRLGWTAYDRALEAWSRREGSAAVDLLAAYGQGLRDIVIGAHAELRSRGTTEPRLSLPAPRPAPDAERDALRDTARAAAELLADAPGGARVDGARAALDACLDCVDAPVHPTPRALDPAKMRNGTKALDQEPCVAYRAAYDAYRQACADHLAAQALRLIDSLLREYSAAYAEAKTARAAVDFEDLQLSVRDLLERDAALRARWSERFELIMVDEFQDTNRLQVAILATLERDNLFAVGDEYQSIYGFRHADVEIFRERGQALGPRGTRRLRTNFRSRRELLDVLNGAFAPAFGPAFEPLVAGRPSDGSGAAAADPGDELRLFDPNHVDATGDCEPAVELLLTDKSSWEEVESALGPGTPGEAPWRRAEARLVARRLRDEVDAGRRPGDIVVLVRAVASLRGLEHALEEAGLPTYVVGGRGYWSQEQVRDGIAYLSVLANPLDEPALYHVLASPFGGAASDDLYRLAREAREAGGAWAALRRGIDGLGHLRPIAGLIERERRLAERLPVEVLLERAIAETGYDLATLGRNGGERRLANLRKLMRLAREYERSEGRDLRGFLAYAVTQDLTEAREGEAALDGEGLDAVRLMTIHRAKGLEFPVVCVADLGRQGPGMRPGLLQSSDGRVGLRLRTLGGGTSVAALDWEALWEERQEREDAEERRLYYVAMTRAREELILSGGIDLAKWPEPRSGGPPLDWIARAIVDDPGAAPGQADGETVVIGEWDGRPAPVRVLVSTAASAGSLAPPAHAGSDRDAPGTALPAEPAVMPVAPAPRSGPLVAGIPRRLSYSSLGDYGRCSYRFYLERVLGLRPVKAPPTALADAVQPTELALDPLARGSLVHSLLEHLDLGSGEVPAVEVIEATAATHNVTLTPADIEDVSGLVGAFVASPLAGRLRAATSIRREAPFAFGLEPGPNAPLVHGFVDVLAYEPDGGVLVVDYKTDRLDGADPEDLVADGYAAQRIVYALAALREGVTRVEVAHCFLERADAPAVAVYAPSDAPALAEQLVTLAGGVLRGEFVPTATPHRELCGTCPGRSALCSWTEEHTLQLLISAGSFSGSGGPS